MIKTIKRINRGVNNQILYVNCKTIKFFGIHIFRPIQIYLKIISNTERLLIESGLITPGNGDLDFTNKNSLR
ncbi:MAG: hypothetical protein K0S53_59 [Bacteroidetes bacterium]|jgi:hypothetical protein|nr:hypothetical protein [Bacteroidota bacterium]MDF2451736.1 hypothetical protein [Bacteroidota bacterium]